MLLAKTNENSSVVNISPKLVAFPCLIVRWQKQIYKQQFMDKTLNILGDAKLQFSCRRFRDSIGTNCETRTDSI